MAHSRTNIYYLLCPFSAFPSILIWILKYNTACKSEYSVLTARQAAFRNQEDKHEAGDKKNMQVRVCMINAIHIIHIYALYLSSIIFIVQPKKVTCHLAIHQQNNSKNIHDVIKMIMYDWLRQRESQGKGGTRGFDLFFSFSYISIAHFLFHFISSSSSLIFSVCVRALCSSNLLCVQRMLGCILLAWIDKVSYSYLWLEEILEIKLCVLIFKFLITV